MKKLLLSLIAVLIVTGCSATIAPEAVYTFNGETVTADEYYDKLFELYGFNYVYQLLQNLVISEYELTDEELANAKTQYDNVMAYYADEESQAYLSAIVRAEGYTGVDELLLYIENNIRKQKIIGAYIDENFTDEAQLESVQSRMVMHVLVQFDENGAFTSATQLMIEEIDGLLATSDPKDMEETFAELIEGGQVVFEDLGYVNKDTSFEEPFLNAALALNKGSLSGWVETSYGFHRIYVYGDSLEDFKGDSDFHNFVLGLDSTYENRALWELISEKAEFSDELATQIKAYLEIED